MRTTRWRTRIALGAAAVLAAGGLQLTTALVAPADATPLGPFSCLPPNGLSTGQVSQADALMSGYLTIPGFKTVFIGTGPHWNWGLNPFNSLAWQKYYTSLKWVEVLTEWYQRHPDQHPTYIPRAEAIASDFAATHPPGKGLAPLAAWNSMYAGQRATVYSCLHSIDSSYGVAALQSLGSWLAVSTHDPGDWNQGVDYNIGLLAAGCVVGNATWADHARDRLISMAGTTIDSQGAIGEQAPGYGPYLWARLGIAADKIGECLGTSNTSVIQSQRAKLLTFLAWSTGPNGMLTQIGDTFGNQAPPSSPTYPEAANTASQWAATLGASGTYPSALFAEYVHAGYAFGRNTWNPYAHGNYYSLRFGPGWAFHGHDDHEQLTLTAYGENVIVDSGHDGYTANAYRTYLRSPDAHSVLVMPGVAFNKYAGTSLTRQSTSYAGWQYYEMVDKAYNNHTRTRDVLVSTDTPFAVVLDKSSRATRGLIAQYWHLPIGMKLDKLTRSRALFTTADGKVDLTLVQLALPGQVLPPGATAVVTGRTSPSYLGWVSYRDGQRTAAPVVTMGRSTTIAGILSVLIPAPHGVAAGAALSRDASGHTIITVIVGSSRHVVSMTNGGFMDRLS